MESRGVGCAPSPRDGSGDDDDKTHETEALLYRIKDRIPLHKGKQPILHAAGQGQRFGYPLEQTQNFHLPPFLLESLKFLQYLRLRLASASTYLYLPTSSFHAFC